MAGEPLGRENIEEYFMRVNNHLATNDITGTLHDAKLKVLQDVGRNFQEATSPTGKKWPKRRNKGDGHPLLIDTTKLSQAALGLGDGKIDEESGREFSVGVKGSVVPYAIKHQTGRNSENLPQREFMGARESTLIEIGEDIADDLLQVFME
jgi:phage gpG-like protein